MQRVRTGRWWRRRRRRRRPAPSAWRCRARSWAGGSAGRRGVAGGARERLSGVEGGGGARVWRARVKRTRLAAAGREGAGHGEEDAALAGEHVAHGHLRRWRIPPAQVPSRKTRARQRLPTSPRGPQEAAPPCRRRSWACPPTPSRRAADRPPGQRAKRRQRGASVGNALRGQNAAAWALQRAPLQRGETYRAGCVARAAERARGAARACGGGKRQRGSAKGACLDGAARQAAARGGARRGAARREHGGRRAQSSHVEGANEKARKRGAPRSRVTSAPLPSFPTHARRLGAASRPARRAGGDAAPCGTASRAFGRLRSCAAPCSVSFLAAPRRNRLCAAATVAITAAAVGVRHAAAARAALHSASATAARAEI